MASDVGVEHPVKRRRFHLHCACGATVASSEKTATCTACGEPVRFHARRSHRQQRSGEENPAAQELLLILGGLLLFALVSFSVGLGWAILASILIAAGVGGRSTRPSPHRAAPNYERKHLYVGLLILLFPALLILIPVLSSNAVQERFAVLNTPKPADCDWSTTPFGAKHCHYESTVQHRSGEIIVTWNRVAD